MAIRYAISTTSTPALSGAIDGVNKVFVLPDTPSPALSLDLEVNGIGQNQGVDYTLSVATITFVIAPLVTDSVLARSYEYSPTPAGGSTKTVADAITRAQNEFKGVTLSATDALDFANEIYQIIGNAALYDWRLASGTRFGTTVDVQDYANVPADFAELIDPCYVQDDAVATNRLFPLAVKEHLPKATLPKTRPASISVENGNFRLFPVPNVTRSGTGQWAILFEYWKKPRRITATTDTFEFDDVWFDTFAAGFNARVADFLDDNRAGQWGGRNPQTNLFVGTGFWGKFAALLNAMVAAENSASGSTVYAPAEGLLRG